MHLNLYSNTRKTNRSVASVQDQVLEIRIATDEHSTEPPQQVSHINTLRMSLHLTFIRMVWAGQTTAAVIYGAGTVRTVFVWASITMITST